MTEKIRLNYNLNTLSSFQIQYYLQKYQHITFNLAVPNFMNSFMVITTTKDNQGNNENQEKNIKVLINNISVSIKKCMSINKV